MGSRRALRRVERRIERWLYLLAALAYMLGFVTAAALLLSYLSRQP